jgi:hypothetical protein
LVVLSGTYFKEFVMEIKLNPEVVEFNVEIEGTRPMLMHSTRSLTAPKSARGSIPTPEQEAELGLYKNKDGEIIIPGLNILACMKAAASDFKMGGKGKKTFKGYIDSGLEVVPDDPLLIQSGYVLDSRPVVIGRARIMRTRPKFEEWKLRFTLRVIDPLLLDSNHDGSILREILESSGEHKGLGDFRPLFGRFAVTKFEKTV